MKLSRLVVLILLLGDILVFFMMQSQFDENGRWALVGMALILAIIWVFLGDSPKQKRQVKRVRSIPNDVDEESEEESQIDIPEAVTKDSLDGATLRERKMAKVAAR